MWSFIHFFSMLVLFILMGPLYVYMTHRIALFGDWRTAKRESANLAPDPLTTPEALVQVYSARTFNWRGLFATHCWVAVKPASAKHYTIYQVAGWRKYSNLSVLVIEHDLPDRFWFGNKPTLVSEVRGPLAELAMGKIAEATEQYPHKYKYVMWPGPNSNTYVAYLGRRVPELRLNLPSIALGKDYLVGSSFLGMAPSGTGIQISIKGCLGVLLARVEGFEFNFLTQVIGFSWRGGFAIKWPGLGRVPKVWVGAKKPGVAEKFHKI